jgi:hypothetical protein
MGCGSASKLERSRSRSVVRGRASPVAGRVYKGGSAESGKRSHLW